MTLLLTIMTILLAAAMIPQSAPQESPPQVVILPPAPLSVAILPPNIPTPTHHPHHPPITITATPECRTQTGTLIPGLLPGNSKSLGEGCGDCDCSNQGVALCTHPSCPKVVCWDSVINGPDCCPVCPNGGNCRTPQGTTVQEDESITEDGQNCTCTGLENNNSREGPMTKCEPLNPPSIPTIIATATSPVCHLINGSISILRRPGDKWDSDDGCHNCRCNNAGVVKCRAKQCRNLTCNFPQIRKGSCCAMCPEDLKLCVIDANTILAVKETRTLANKTRCSCTFNEERSVVLDCNTPTSEDQTEEMDDI